MSCPLLRRSHPPECRAVAGGPAQVDRDVAAAYCRGSYGDCPAYRYLRAAGRHLHPADFHAWVVEGLSPGRLVAPATDVQSGTDAG